jgi:ankyrin repeat protein
VRLLVEAGAPLDHVNSLGWTPLIEAIILGDGRRRHTDVVRILVNARAAVNLADRDGTTPPAHATSRGYNEMATILRGAGAR